MAPMFSARRFAASFPLGSIIPYNRSCILIHSKDWRLAIVPETSVAVSVTLKYVSLSVILYLSTNSRVQSAVIILVRLATSLRIRVLEPTINQWCTTQHSVPMHIIHHPTTSRDSRLINRLDHLQIVILVHSAVNCRPTFGVISITTSRPQIVVGG